MPEYSSTKVAETKQRLIDGMLDFMAIDPEEKDDKFDCGYSRDDVDCCSSIVDAYLAEMASKNDANDSEILQVIQKVVLELNDLNKKCGGGLIETDQREDLCEIILSVAQTKGLSTTDDVTEEWREW